MRNRYLDLLRAAAIVRVIIYHLFGWPWLSILLPAMGIMFALAGSLTAASLDRRSAGQVITSRLRRLLPPLWLLAVVAVPAMLYLGWTREDGGDEPLTWKLGLWLLPIGDPPGSARGIDVWEPLWYVRAYLWFVLLSPLLYLAYKKIGWGAVAAPILVMAVLDKTDLSLPFGRADAAMWDFVTYGACWIAGFAHHDGRLARIRPGLVVAASAILGLAALYWLRGHAGEGSWDLNDVSESQALWSLAFVLLALRWQPDMSWLQRRPRVDAAVNVLNARAVTIYLWHNIAIAAIWPILTVLTLDDLGELDGPTDLIASLALTVGAVLAFGWVEDLAARRKPTLWPTGDGRREPKPPPSSPPGPGPAGPGFGSSSASQGLGFGVGAPRRGGSDRAGTGAGTAEAPWAGAAAAPIVVGGAGPVPRRRDYVAPFPEAEVSFGLPEAGSGFEGGEGGSGVGAGASGVTGAHRSGPPVIPGRSVASGAVASGPVASGPVASGAAVFGALPSGPAELSTNGTGPSPASGGSATGQPAPGGPAAGESSTGSLAGGPSAPGEPTQTEPARQVGPPAQARRHDPDDREAVVPWFGGEREGPR